MTQIAGPSVNARPPRRNRRITRRCRRTNNSLIQLALVCCLAHSFTTDLIEIAGAESVTHGIDELRVPMTVAELQASAPDLVLIVSASPISEDDRRDARALIGDGPEIAFMVFDRKHFWLRRAVETARQLRERLQPLVRGPLLDPSGVTPLDVRPVDATRLAPAPGTRPRAPVYP